MLKAFKFLILMVAAFMIYNALTYEVLAAEDTTVESGSKEMAIEDKYLIRFMEAIKDRNTDVMLELWVGKESELTLKTFNDLYDYWNGKEITSYKKMGEKQRSANEKKKQPSGTEYEYEITSAEEIIRLRFSITDEYKGGRYIDSFQFLNKVQSTGAIGIQKKMEIAKWGMMILMMAEIIFSLVMLILCIKERPKLWVFWGMAILLVYGGITIGIAQKFKLGIFIYLLDFPQIFISSTGFVLHLSMPLGAIAYYCVRKRLNKTVKVKNMGKINQ